LCAQVAFENAPAPGFYDTGAEQQTTREVARVFRPTTLEELEGGKRRKARRPAPARTARCTVQSLLRGVQCAILRAAVRKRLAQAVTGGPVRAWAVEAAGLCWLLCALQAGVTDRNSY